MSDQLADSPLDRHCRRVAALALEVGACLRLTTAERLALEKAALLHHARTGFLGSGSVDRLTADLHVNAGPAVRTEPAVSAVLAAFEARPVRRGTDRPALLAEILEAADFFDDRLRFLPYELITTEQIVDELASMAQDGLYSPSVITALASLARLGKENLLEQVRRLPVFPSVALRALELASDEDASLGQLGRVASSDQVLAGRLIQAANSSLFGARMRISSIPQAVSYIGLDAARKILMASVFHPLFASQSLRDLWKHSLEISQLADRLAQTSRKVAPEQAFLAGLVHDVGRLALQRCAVEQVVAYTRLVERGCEPVFADMVLCGCDHGATGAEILREWSFPEALVTAVQQHHQPEHSSSELASLLYLAEYWSGSEEDLPSAARLRYALERAGLTLEKLRNTPCPGEEMFNALAGAA